MRESVMMRRRVEDEGLRVVNSCREGTRWVFDGTSGGSHGKLCASSRGNTEVASVVRIYWA
jgi:hypothetical protein